MELFFSEEDVLEILSFVAREASIKEIQLFWCFVIHQVSLWRVDDYNIDNYFIVVKW